MFSWGGLTDRDHMHGPPMARWKFVTAILVWVLITGAFILLIAS
jgi:hypothetical protein